MSIDTANQINLLELWSPVWSIKLWSGCARSRI